MKIMNELAIPETMSLVSSNITEDQIEKIGSSSEYFKRIQLIGSNSDAAKEGKINMGNYAYIIDKENMKDIGNEVDVLVCGMRLKAMRISGDEICNVYDSENPEFKDIFNQRDVKESGCLCGYEFLIWLPSEKDFVTFFMASKSARREAPNLRLKMNEKENKPGPATLKVKLASNAKYKWHATVISECSTPFDLPEITKMIEAITKFQNPPKDDRELVKDEERAR